MVANSAMNWYDNACTYYVNALDSDTVVYVLPMITAYVSVVESVMNDNKCNDAVY